MAPAKPPLLRERVQRAFAHGEMKRVCNQIQRSSLSPTLDQLFSKPLEPELRTVARAFVELQDARHGADYDTSEPIARLEAAQKIYLADQAFEAWDAIKNTPNATIFLAALLLNAKWSWNESE
ncbi:MAG: hypothetical protein ACREFD_10650 [Stellaceae bacterium]